MRLTSMHCRVASARGDLVGPEGQTTGVRLPVEKVVVLLADKHRPGRLSTFPAGSDTSSRISTVAILGAPRIAPVGLLSVMVAVSVPSLRESSVIRTTKFFGRLTRRKAQCALRGCEVSAVRGGAAQSGVADSCLSGSVTNARDCDAKARTVFDDAVGRGTELQRRTRTLRRPIHNA